MTHADRSHVTRETSATVRDRGRVRPIVATLNGAGILLRLKGCRLTFLLPYDVAYWRAARLQAEQARAEKRAARKGGSR